MKKTIICSIFIIIFLFFFQSAQASTQIIVKEDVKLDNTIYNISWIIQIDDPEYYYPKGEWGLPLPPNANIEAIKAIDNFGEVEFKIRDNYLYLYNSKPIYYGEVYYFNVSFIQKYNPVSYDSEFYFISGYQLKSTADKIIIKLPLRIKNYNIIGNDSLYYNIIDTNPYTIELTSNKTIYPEIIFVLDNEENKIIQEYNHFYVYLPEKYRERIQPIIENINKTWQDFENLFNRKISKLNISFLPYSFMQEDELCLYNYSGNSIVCGIHLLTQEDKEITRTLNHEITHAFIDNTFGRGLPPWFDEGLAETLSFYFSEKLGYNFTDYYTYRQEIINTCKNDLYESIWDYWECERFGKSICVLAMPGNRSECFEKYKISDIEYTFSWYIINNEIVKNVGIDKINYLSNYFQVHNITVNLDSDNKNSIVVLMFFIVSNKDFSEILNKTYKIKIESLWKESYKTFKDAENEISDLVRMSDYDYYRKAKDVLYQSLVSLLNGKFNESIERALESIRIAKEIERTAKETKQKIIDINQSVLKFRINTSFSCVYNYPQSLLLEAFQDYKVGNFEDAASKAEIALDKAQEISESLSNFIKKFNNLSNQINATFFIYQPFLSQSKKKLEDSWALLLDCKLEDAQEALLQTEKEMKTSMILSSILYIFVVIIFGVIVWRIRALKIKKGKF